MAVMLPMGPLAIALYLGCVLAGCMVVSIADSFAPHEVATRLRIAHTRLVFTQVGLAAHQARQTCGF